MSAFPAPLRGDDPIVGWLNKLRLACIEGQINTVTNGKLTKGQGGATLALPDQAFPGRPLYIRVCKRDATEVYLKFMMADQQEYDEGDLPEGANIFDPTP